MLPRIIRPIHQRITVRGPFGLRTVDALVHGDWAASRMPERPELWILTLMPLGFALPFEWASFRTAQRACAAMADIQIIRNDWSVIVQASLTPALKEQLIRICRRHGAVEGPLTMAWREDKRAFGQIGIRRVNGYAVPEAR